MEPGLFDILSLESVPKEDIPCFLSLQGVVNRKNPRIYFLPESEGFEKHWIEWYRHYGLEGKEISPDDLLSGYANLACGYIVYDPQLPDSLNVAMSLAGVENALVCQPSGASKLETFGLPLVADFSHRRQDKISASQWAVREVMPRCDLSILGNYDQGEEPRPFPTMVME